METREGKIVGPWAVFLFYLAITVSRERRIIFAEALASDGESVSSRRALDVDVLRYPLFIAELSGTKVTLAMEVPRRHAWGNIPVPAF